MGMRLGRVKVGEARFRLLPEGFVRRIEEPNSDKRDIEAIYRACWRQVFGTDPVGSVGKYRNKLAWLAKKSGLAIPLFTLIVMFGHSKTYPQELFKPSMLADGRALVRAEVYARACVEQYSAVNAALLDQITGTKLADNDLDTRMFNSEIKAGRWIIGYKMTNPGLPFEPMLEALEDTLDPNWLATEKYYEPVIQACAQQTNEPKKVRHAALRAYRQMKKHKHDAIANFRSRQKMMPEAVRKVLSQLDLGPGDFEIADEPVTDPLLFWHHLALAIQHLECVLLIKRQQEADAH